MRHLRTGECTQRTHAQRKSKKEKELDNKTSSYHQKKEMGAIQRPSDDDDARPCNRVKKRGVSDRVIGKMTAIGTRADTINDTRCRVGGRDIDR